MARLAIDEVGQANIFNYLISSFFLFSILSYSHSYEDETDAPALVGLSNYMGILIAYRDCRRRLKILDFPF